MAAVILESDEAVTEEVSELPEATAEAQPEQEQAPEPEQPPEPELPEKYRNKSMADIVRMHQEAEKLAHRHSQEIGELRKVFDTHIQSQLSQQAPQQDESEDIDFFTDPDKAVAKAIEQHPALKKAEKAAQEFDKQNSLARLKSMHPDMDDIFGNQQFGEWVKSSQFRVGLLRKAHFEFNVDAADELISLWKDRQSVVTQTANAEKQARKSQAKSASTGTPKGSSEPTSRKIYRRTDIINLMKNDPARYESLSDEIMKAYAENRVR